MPPQFLTSQLITKLVFILISAFIAIFINEYLKRPKLEFDTAAQYHKGGIRKIVFRIKNKQGLWFLERHAAQECKAALNYSGSEIDSSLEFTDATTKLSWEGDSFGTKIVERRNIFSDETADCYGLAEVDGDYYLMHTEDRIHTSEKEELIENKNPLSEKTDVFILQVRSRNGSRIKRKFHFDELEDPLPAKRIGKYP